MKQVLTFAWATAIASSLCLPALAAEPSVEQCLAANESSISLRAAHKLLQARTELLTCVAASCPTEIQRECIRRMDQVTAAIPTLVFRATDREGKDLSEVTVTMDGAPLADKLEGLAIAVEPGQHTFRLVNAAYPAVEKQVLVHEGEKDRHVEVLFGSSAPAAKVVDAPPAAAPRRSRTFDILALSSAGVGAIGLGVGTVFGVMAMSRHDEAQKACPQSCANDEDAQLWRDATSAGNVSTVGFVVGAAGLASAVTFWVFGNRSSSSGPSTRVGLAPGSVVVGGTW